jgi:hypothetical protein
MLSKNGKMNDEGIKINQIVPNVHISSIEIEENPRVIVSPYLKAKANSVLSMSEEYATSNGVLPLNEGLERRILLCSRRNPKCSNMAF